MVKFGMDLIKKIGLAGAVLVVGLGLVGQGALITGMVATVLGWVIVVGAVLLLMDSFK